MFSKWLRREDTGLMDEPSVFSSLEESMAELSSLVSQHRDLVYSCS
jgi:hypothetical protein